MGKNCLAVFGLLFLALLTVAGVLAGAVFMDMAGIGPRWVNVQGTPVLPQDYSSSRAWLRDLLDRTGLSREPEVRVDGVPVTPRAPGDLGELLPGGSSAHWTNPLDMNPPVLAFPTPEPVPTPLPPMDPGVYRTEALLRMKAFAGALDAFLAANDRLSQENSLLNDADWRIGMELTLEDVASTAQDLILLGPPPAEYASIDAALEQAGVAGGNLASSYLEALQSGDAQGFETAGEYFEQIRAHLSLAVEEMIRAGWPLE